MQKPKLLIPDIKGEANIVYEEGRLYPHHNLYYITSNEWDLHALQAVLKSGIAKLFVSIYSTQMRGGYLRYQAQYLRRIRVPQWSDVPEGMRKTLIEAARAGDVEACNHATFELFGLSKAERSAIGGERQQGSKLTSSKVDLPLRMSKAPTLAALVWSLKTGFENKLSIFEA